MTLTIATYLMLCFLQGLNKAQEGLVAVGPVLWAGRRAFHNKRGIVTFHWVSGARQKP